MNQADTFILPCRLAIWRFDGNSSRRAGANGFGGWYGSAVRQNSMRGTSNLVDVSGGSWGGAVYDVDAILRVIAARKAAFG